MLTRILEPEVMDTEQEARDYDSMDHWVVNRAFVHDLFAAASRLGLIAIPEIGGGLGEILGKLVEKYGTIPAPTRLRVLDLGTGTALIPIEFAGATGGPPSSPLIYPRKC